MGFFEDIQDTKLCGDGAMGTLLMERGIPLTRCFEELCVRESELIIGIHAEYLAAGARVIETNSFGANAIRLARFGFEAHVNEINWQAAQLAKTAVKGSAAYVGGSVGPLGISKAEAELQGIDRKAILQEQIGALLDGGVNVMLFQTFTDVEELLLALYIKQSLHHLPAVCMLACRPDGILPDGTSLRDAFLKLRDAGADAVGINCISGEDALQLIQYAPADIPFAVYPNDTTPDAFTDLTRKLLDRGAALIGGCCGTTPAHIRRIADVISPPVE